MLNSDAARDRSDAQRSLEPILVALERIEAQGSLMLFAPDHGQRVRLMKLMTEFELVVWNAEAKKYELTPFGSQCLVASRGTTYQQATNQSEDVTESTNDATANRCRL